jgi:predicted metalloprotease
MPSIHRIRAAAIALALVLLSLLAASGRASAMTPAQSTESGVVNMLGGWQSAYYNGSIEDFWRRTLPAWGYGYSKPAIKYYGDGSGGYYNTLCGATYPWRGENGFYCSSDNTIYLDYWGQQGLLNRLGDHGAGGFLAHEWGHRAQTIMRTTTNDFRSEYNADCMAGLYTRYGYATGRLSGNDLWEFNAWLAGQPSSASHGTGANRAAWFQYGYTQYSKAACDRTMALTASGAKVASALAAARRLRPPAHAKVDLTPRRTHALPKSAPHVEIPSSRRPDAATPIG